MTRGEGPPPVAAVIAVGTELLASGRPDRNTPLLKERLSDLGVAVGFSAVAPDERSLLEETLRMALGRCRYVLVCGGLGPTTDDLTRFAASDALGARLVEDATSLASIEARFRNRGIEMPEVNRRQALIPEGAAALPNPAGTAPGVLARTGAGAWLVLLPGPPAELAAMFDAEVRPRLERESGRTGGRVRETLMVAGLPESVLQERILDLTPARDAADRLAILASGGEIEIRVTGPAGRSAEVRGLADRIAERLGPAVFSRVAGEHLEHAVGRLLERRGERAAFAESLTGGLIAERLTRVPGSSGWFDLGVVAYANEAKRDLLEVPEAALLAHGAVSEAVAMAMAEGARRRSGNAWGVAVTGIAGPGGGSVAKPVGLVWVAVSGPVSLTRRFRLPGDRPLVRQLTATAALDLLRQTMLAAGEQRGGQAEGGEAPG
ncbi:MAG: CinA family nicotinamide mononucleotide deamidase-related protein [Acidobacteria bacterium]|nr:CinA family nicotinamide mononucleotide deamidase-related protein [Acidobacteriota bacterium]MYG75781.1 CinA family nicotinamide mononucleotide deamidase-related protein [Acidobacteriota bacterium]